VELTRTKKCLCGNVEICDLSK